VSERGHIVVDEIAIPNHAQYEVFEGEIFDGVMLTISGLFQYQPNKGWKLHPADSNLCGTVVGTTVVCSERYTMHGSAGDCVSITVSYCKIRVWFDGYRDGEFSLKLAMEKGGRFSNRGRN